MTATINATVIETITPTIAPVLLNSPFGVWTTATIIFIIPSHANNVNCEI